MVKGVRTKPGRPGMTMPEGEEAIFRGASSVRYREAANWLREGSWAFFSSTGWLPLKALATFAVKLRQASDGGMLQELSRRAAAERTRGDSGIRAGGWAFIDR